MDWVDRPLNYKGLYGILKLLQGSHLNNFPLKTVKLRRVAFHSVTFQLECLDFQYNQYKKLAPVLCLFICMFVFASNSGQFQLTLLNYVLFNLFFTFSKKMGGGEGGLKPPGLQVSLCMVPAVCGFG